MVVLAKMPKTVGTQDNPMLCLDVQLNPSGAYETALGGVRCVDPEDDAEITGTLETLIAQKSKPVARMDVPNMFGRPGYLAFFRDLSASPRTSALVELSRLDVGETPAAVNLGLTFG